MAKETLANALQFAKFAKIFSHQNYPLYGSVVSLLTAVGGWREPAGCHTHSTDVVGEEVYLWAGWQYEMPHVHDSAEKQAFLSSVEVFNVNTGCWERRTTCGTPPLGVRGYSCVAVRTDLYYFGGGCGHSGCYHNSVHTLSTSTLQWRMLAPTTSEDGAPEEERLWSCALH